MQSFQEQELFCQECGAANAAGARICAVCQQSLPLGENTIHGLAPMPQTRQGTNARGGAHTKQSGLLHERYRVLREIGQGGFGEVYLARDYQQRRRLVALKKIELSGLSPQEIIEVTASFNREVLLLSQLNHRGLPHLYENFTEGNSWYLVIEYIHGYTLEEVLARSRRGYLSLRRAAHIAHEVADVLWYLHRQHPPIIFRDVKPANIMLTRTGRVYLIDFGIARRFSPNKKRDTGPLGSPGYAAPEQYGRAQTDARTDIYGLGATLQTLLTGCHPLELGMGEAPRNPRPLPAQLQELLDATMEADPDRRPPQMLDFEERLRKILRHQPGGWLAAGRGMLQGIPLLVWGALIVLLDVLSAPSQTVLPFYSSLQCLLLVFNSLFPLSIVAMAIWQFGKIISRRSPWQAAGTLIMLVLTIILVVMLNMAFLSNKLPWY